MVQFDIDEIFSAPSDPTLDFPYDSFADSSLGLSPVSNISDRLDFDDDLFKEMSSLSEDSEREEMFDPSTFINIQKTSDAISVKREITSPKPCPLTSAILNVPELRMTCKPESANTGTEFLNGVKPEIKPEITRPRKTVQIVHKSEPGDTKSYRNCMRSDRSFKIYIPSKKLSGNNIISVNIKQNEGGQPLPTHHHNKRPRASEAPRIVKEGRNVQDMSTAEKAFSYYTQMKNTKAETKSRRSGRNVMTVPGHLKTDDDVRNWKKQQRMLKNRESACLSRRRKKEYLGAIETELSMANQHGAMLATENSRLHKESEVTCLPSLNKIYINHNT